MRVSWVINGDELGGDAQMVRGLASRVAEAGVGVSIVSLVPGRFYEECRNRGIESICLNAERFPVFGGGAIRNAGTYFQASAAQRRLAPALARVASDLGADVLHTTWPNFLVAVGEAAQIAGAGCVWEVQNILSGRYPFGINRRLIQSTLRRYRYTVLAMGSMVAESLGDAPVTPHLFYLGADERRFRPEMAAPALRAELGFPANSAVLGMFVRLIPEKGCHQVLEAIASLRSRYPELCALIVGGPHDTEYGQAVRSLCDSPGLRGAAKLLEFTPTPEKYYGAMDFVASVRRDPEPFGLAAVEAMLMGKPVLVNPLGGPAETVVDGSSGWHLAGPGTTQIADGIERALAARSRWVEMGSRGRERALRQFSLQRQVDLYLRLIGAAATPAAVHPPAVEPACAVPRGGRRVAWLVAGDEAGGVAQAIRGLARSVSGSGIEPVIVGLKQGDFTRELADAGYETWVIGTDAPPVLVGNTVHKLQQQGAIWRASRRISPAIIRVLRQAPVQALHVLWPHLMPIAATVARRLDIPCIWEMPNALSRYPFGLNRRILQMAIRHWGVTCIANSQFTAHTLGGQSARPTVIHPGGDESRFMPNPPDAVQRADLEIPADHAVYAVVARVTPLKGQPVVVGAFRRFVERYPKSTLLLIGPAETAEFLGEIGRLANSATLAGRVRIIGAVPNPERYYPVIDVAVSAPLAAEAYGLSVVEAMLAGKPVLAGAFGGPAETVVDGVTGWLMPEAGEEAVLRGLLRAAGDRSRWADMGAEGRARALESFSLRSQTARYADLISRIAG